MNTIWTSRPGYCRSRWIMCLLLIGVVGWLSPIVSAARRTRSATSQEIILPLGSAGELCVQGTSVAGQRRFALIGGQTISVGEQLKLDGQAVRVVAIEAEQVRLQRVADAGKNAATMK